MIDDFGPETAAYHRTRCPNSRPTDNAGAALDYRGVFSSLKSTRVAIQEGLKRRGPIAVAYDALVSNLKDAGREEEAREQERASAQVERLLDMVELAAERMESVERNAGNAMRALEHPAAPRC